MKPLICFFKNDQFIYATQYRRVACYENQTVNDFLNEIENKEAATMKVVQINFEYESINLFAHQENLYSCAKASVFILEKFEFLSESVLLQRLDTSEKIFSADFKSLESQSVYIEKVNIIKKEIAAGRIYQVNLTAPLKSACTASSEEIFTHYSTKFNGAYKALLPLEKCDVISFSPELFLQKIGTQLLTRPIKGSLAQNENFEKDLLLNKKEEAELSMIVDLLRNDLNRIETNSSAIVTKHRQAMQLGYIQHTFSEIQIETNKNLAAILESTLPGGSISGCPKIESLKLISELEVYKRQVYTGVLGWWQGKDFCLNLSIRTFIKSKDELYYHSGCGIVYDSLAEKEWNEFLLKTGSLKIKK